MNLKQQAPPSMKRKSIDPDSYYKNLLSDLNISSSKTEKAFKRFRRELKIDQFQLNDIFFRNIMRKREFGAAQTSLELAFSKICKSKRKRPLTIEIVNNILVVQNLNRSITLFLFEENNVLWGSTSFHRSAGYFCLKDQSYLKQFKIWFQDSLNSSVENAILQAK